MTEIAELLKGCHCWSLNVNEHRAYYEGVRSFLTKSDMLDSDDGDPEALIAACEASDSIWQLQVYPETPVSFILLTAPDLDGLMTLAREHISKETPCAS